MSQLPVVRPDDALSHAEATAREVQQAIDQWSQKRAMVVEFLATQLVPADLNEQGFPINGDYWKYPKSKAETYRLTKQGAQKAGTIASLYAANAQTRIIVNTTELVILEYDLEIVSSTGERRGFGTGSVSSAEDGFMAQASRFGIRYKNGVYQSGDWRSAWNALSGKARTRAFINGIENALAIGEVFAEVLQRMKRPQLTSDGATSRLRIPHGKFIGLAIDDPKVGSKYLGQLEQWYRGNGNDRAADQIVEELERRRQAGTEQPAETQDEGRADA